METTDILGRYSRIEREVIELECRGSIIGWTRDRISKFNQDLEERSLLQEDARKCLIEHYTNLCRKYM
jgi:hypothetical protein